MKVLLGTIYVGQSKSYVLHKFAEMCEKVVKDVDVVVVTDQPEVVEELGLRMIPYPGPPTFFATEICRFGKHVALKEYALQNDYDYLIWQGIDALYKNAADLHRLILKASTTDGICGALVAGRNRADYPVCREFTYDIEGNLSTAEKELHPIFFEIPTARPVLGFVGGDATVISREVLQKVSMDSYLPWETHRNSIPNILGPDEFLMFKAIKDHGIVPVCHLGVRPFHVHEDGTAVRYPNETKQLDQIEW